uniref:Survival of motor neuron-related-splicing factor 30 n=1 Tax=Timema bartmani TaxID=61472 RepID=A0A7R9HVS2_9NEOP|nr:unnamed protein product [Timema bartmani]
MGCEITTCSFVTAPLTSHSQPVPDRRKELFLFVTVETASLQYCTVDGSTKQLRIRSVYQRLALLLVSLSQAALEQVQRNLAPRLCDRLHCNRSGVTLLLVSLSHAALEQVQSNLAPRLCDRLRCNRSGATLFLYAPEIFWSSRTVERKWIRCVEAALTTDPDNAELLKLKTDLEEVLELTRDLLKAQLIEQQPDSSLVTKEDELSVDELVEQAATKRDWKVGDRCLALWREDGQYYEATIEDITQDGEEVSVVFDNYKNSDVTTLSLLREIRGGGNLLSESGVEGKSKKQVITKQREYQKKKKMKKLQRYKQMEEEREGEKNKWLAFKQSNKSAKKVMTKKSIFASPDNVNGRVGIGTCGMSGKPMTEFTTAEKWKKGRIGGVRGCNGERGTCDEKAVEGPRTIFLVTWNHIVPEMLYFTLPGGLSGHLMLARPFPHAFSLDNPFALAGCVAWEIVRLGCTQ